MTQGIGEGELLDSFRLEIVKLSKGYIPKPIFRGPPWRRKPYCPKCRELLYNFEYGATWQNGGKWTLYKCNCGYEYGFRDIGGWGRDIHPRNPEEVKGIKGFNKEDK